MKQNALNDLTDHFVDKTKSDGIKWKDWNCDEHAQCWPDCHEHVPEPEQ